MKEAEFWSLIGELGGVADEESVARLAETLASLPKPVVEAFDTALEERVEALAEAPAVPEELRYSETAEWFAAAIVAAGEPAYRKALSAQEPLDVDAWAYAEAEDLLVVAESILDPEQLGLAVEIEWLSPVFPDDVDPAENPVGDEFDDLDSQWGVPAADDSQIERARDDIAGAPAWRSWIAAQPARPGSVAVAIEDDMPLGLQLDGRPQAPHYRYVVPAQRLLECADRRAEMRRVLVDAWSAIAGSVGWAAPPADPGGR